MSVITSTRDRASMLREAIESVLAQTFQEWEHIIVDDGSVDETARVVQSYAARDGRIRYLPRANGGLPVARNTGLRYATGRYVAFLDDDDLFLPGKLSQQLEAMEANPGWAFVYGPVRETHDNRIAEQMVPAKPSRTFAELFEGGQPQVSSILVRRSCLDKVGGTFNEQLPHCQDYELWLRLAARFPFGYQPEPVGIYRRHRTNMSRKLIGIYTAQLAILRPTRRWRELGILAAARRRRLASVIYELARHQLEAGRYMEAERSFLLSVAWRPDIGLLVREYRRAGPQNVIRKFLKPYLGIVYCLIRGLRYAGR